MPKINLEYDTETKQLTCKCDDDDVNMQHAGFYQDGEDGQYRMEVGLKTEENCGMKKYSMLSASKQKDSIQFGKYFLVADTNWFNNVIKNKN